MGDGWLRRQVSAELHDFQVAFEGALSVVQGIANLPFIPLHMYDAYGAYRSAGVGPWDSAVMGVGTSTPILQGIVSSYELADGVSLRGDDLGRKLNDIDQLGRWGTIFTDASMAIGGVAWVASNLRVSISPATRARFLATAIYAETLFGYLGLLGDAAFRGEMINGARATLAPRIPRYAALSMTFITCLRCVLGIGNHILSNAAVAQAIWYADMAVAP